MRGAAAVPAGLASAAMNRQPQPPELNDEAPDRDVVEQQDFAARTVIMSNAIHGGVSPVAGSIAAEEDLGLDPTLDETAPDDETA